MVGFESMLRQSGGRTMAVWTFLGKSKCRQETEDAKNMTVRHGNRLAHHFLPRSSRVPHRIC
jgi:hypothetical protein